MARPSALVGLVGLVALGGLVAGCARGPVLPVRVATPPEAAVVVSALDVQLPSADDGQLQLTVEAPTWPVALVSYELWLGGVVVASGLTSQAVIDTPARGRVRVTVRARFDVRAFPWRPGARLTEVRVRGRLLASLDEGAPFLEWAAHRHVEVAGLPDVSQSQD